MVGTVTLPISENGTSVAVSPATESSPAAYSVTGNESVTLQKTYSVTHSVTGIARAAKKLLGNRTSSIIIQEIPDVEVDWTKPLEVNTSKNGKRKHFNWAVGSRGSRKRYYGGTFDRLPIWRQQAYEERSAIRRAR